MTPYNYALSSHMNGIEHGAGIIGFFIMAFIGLIILAVVVWLARLAVRNGAMPSFSHDNKLGLSKPAEQSRAIDILKERLAKGELTKEQYEELKKIVVT